MLHVTPLQFHPCVATNLQVLAKLVLQLRIAREPYPLLCLIQALFTTRIMAAGSVDICASLSSLLILVGSGLRYDYDLWILFPSNLTCGLGFETSGDLVSMGSCAHGNEQSESYQVNQDMVVILLCEFTESVSRSHLRSEPVHQF